MNTWKVEFISEDGWTKNDNMLILEGRYQDIVNSFKDELVKITPLNSHKAEDNFMKNHYFEEFSFEKIQEKTQNSIERNFKTQIDKIKKKITEQSKKGNTFVEIDFDNHEEFSKISYYFENLGFTFKTKGENITIHW